MRELSWLPADPEWKSRLAAVPRTGAPIEALRALAAHPLDFVQTAQLDRRLETAVGELPSLRLALLASSTVAQLLPGLRVAALRRGYRLETFLPEYGQYRQALLDPSSPLRTFAPDAVLIAADAQTVVGSQFIADEAAATAAVDARVAELASLWRVARADLSCQVIQQALLPVFPAVIGAAEYRTAGAPATRVVRFNERMRAAATTAAVDVLALDERARLDGLDAWFSAPLWHRAKQEISPAAGPFYGELVVRMMAARKGHSSKCLVLDLDNTLWGGVIGDDGLQNIELGQGSAGGEAFVAFQSWAKALGQRGVILAVCSKNDESNALEPFEKHPDMILRRSDIASFVANWDDKATNIRRIARNLNIGLDSLVFVDDNPFERNIVRRELPMIQVPELPEDPSLWAACLADAGYFEALDVTAEDLKRGDLYQATQALREGAVAATDLEGYLKSLQMRLVWGRFDPLSMKRVTQLINKTNQFNLTTRRYTEADTAAMLDDPAVLGLHLRLVDNQADHGIIGVIIGRDAGDGVLDLDTWLMSCRVLGRGVEKASLAVLAGEAKRRGFRSLSGLYLPTAKNGMVRDHYAGLGFAPGTSDPGGESRWFLDLAADVPHSDSITLEVAANA